MNKLEAMKAANACPRVVDDFGARGRVVGWVMGDDDVLAVKWDGEKEYARVHYSRIRIDTDQNEART